MRQLDVYVNDIKAGVLTEKHPGDGYCFQYEADYYLSDAPSKLLTFIFFQILGSEALELYFLSLIFSSS